jgi:glycosyltransferase involved in cell wall biosynthesis
MEHMRSLGLPFEIIIGSNGSTDRTVALARQICSTHGELRYFHLPKKGVGAAFRQGVMMAHHPHIITVDMDLSIDLGFISSANQLLDRHHVVIGSKITGDQKRPHIRKAASNLFIRLAGLLLNIRFQDYSIAAKGYRTDVVRRYLDRIDEWTFYVVEVVYRVNRDGYRIVQAPVICRDMRGSRFNLFHEGIYKFGNLLRLWLTSLQGR